MKVKFWGTRGSIPKPGRNFLRHGGNTSCVELRSEAGTLVVIDCGTGVQDLGDALAAGAPGGVRGAIMISHTHWDHIQGLPFFAPLFNPKNDWQIYAPRGLGGSLRQTLAGQMQYDYFPIELDAMGAQIGYHDLTEGVFTFGDIRVVTRYLDHPALTLGYRFEADGQSVVYACDHEPPSRKAVPDQSDLEGAERRHVEFLRDADLVIHDAQYTVEEYPTYRGWGHGSHDYAAMVCTAAGARRLAFTHHDPRRTDDALDRITASLRETYAPRGLEVEAAAEGVTIDLGPALSAPAPAAERQRDAEIPVDAVIPRLVGLGPLAPEVDKVIRDAIEAEGLDMAELGAESAPREGPEPALVIRDAAQAAGSGTATAETGADPGAGAAHLFVLSGASPEAAAAAAGDATRMLWPFSSQYARTRIRAALLGEECRWRPGPIPADEEQRLAALRHLSLVPSPREERFDSISRAVAEAFGVPVVLVSLMESDRQWFKSCVGTEFEETPREVAFCSHTVAEDRPLVVPDTMLDPRFADNPMVASGPRVRFYAGHPLRSPEGFVLGTLCLIDLKPRDLDDEGLRRLAEFAARAEAELHASAPA